MVKVNAVLPQALASNIGYPVAPHEQKRVGGGYNAPPPQSYSAPPPQAAPQMPPPQQQRAPAPPPPSGSRYIAVYDYTAADDNEISFQEGDAIIDVTVIDEDWMEGRVERTGAYGMLPSNYVEKV